MDENAKGERKGKGKGMEKGRGKEKGEVYMCVFFICVCEIDVRFLYVGGGCCEFVLLLWECGRFFVY